MSIIKMIDIQKEYLLGETVVPALKGVDLTIDKGEFVAIYGPLMNPRPAGCLSTARM